MKEELKDSCYKVQGNTKLKGAVRISGSKNATLPVLAATLLTDREVTLKNVPWLKDVRNMTDVLKELGARANYENGVMTVNTKDVANFETSFELMNKMRASIYVMGPMLARFGRVKVAMPGGCAIGSRPIDYHLNGLRQMGVQIQTKHGYVDARVEKLKGAKIYLDFPSVGATANIMMAAVLARGTTVIDNAAAEPHIVDLEWFLKSIGARIKGAGSRTITIDGVSKLHGAEHTMIPDQIEAGTFMVAAAITRGNVTLESARAADLKPIIVKLQEAGVNVRELKNAIRVSAKKNLKPAKITTMPHPGFPTDMQPQMMALLSTCSGVSVIKEAVWENRFMHVAEMIRMGANLDVQGHTCIITGVDQLTGSKVVAPDLRAGAALVLAGIAAENTTTVYDIYHIDRGYENFAAKLNALGADVTRIDSE